MKEKLELREDDRLRDARFKQYLVSAKQHLRMTCIATPLLVGCMYLLMRHLPKDAFPPNFWMMALLTPFAPFLLIFGTYYPLCRFVHLKCILSPKGIRFSMPEAQMIAWGSLAEWQIQDSQEHPGHFTVEFRPRRGRRVSRITVPSTYSKKEIRAFILRYAPNAA